MALLMAIDEFGEFNKYTEGVRFVGGCKKVISEYEYESEKVTRFLKSICDNYNNSLKAKGVSYRVVYPYSIHTSNITFFVPESDSNPNAKNNKDAIHIKIDGMDYVNILGRPDYLRPYVNEMRKLMRNLTVDFIKNNGYEMFAFMQIDDSFETNSKSNITDLNLGINLYERLAVLTVINNIYYSSESVGDSFFLDIAQMTAPGSKEYSNLFTVNERNRLVVTRTSTYKTALSTFLYDREGEIGSGTADYHLNVAEANYYFTDAAPTPFLYLADIACAIISNRLYQKFEVDTGKNKEKITGKGLAEIAQNDGIAFRIYGQAEIIYKKMIESVRVKDFDRFYGYMYELKNIHDVNGVATFYLNSMVKQCEKYFVEKLKSEKNYRNDFSRKMPEMIRRIEEYMSHRNIKYEQGLFMAEKICGLAEEYADSNQKDRYLFVLNDMIMQGYNHRGAVDESRRLMAVCEKYKDGVTCEEYLDHVNKALNIHINNFEFDEALKKAKSLVGSITQLKNTYFYIRKNVGQLGTELANTGLEDMASQERYALAGEIFSSVGQIYAFKRNYSQATMYFQKALKEFERGDFNYNMTMSFYLLMLIDSDKKEEYELLSGGYFGSNDIAEQCEKAIESGNNFMFSLFVKSYRAFYNTKANIGLLKRMVKYVKEYENAYEHPWELIYKNIYESMYAHKDEFDSDLLNDIRAHALLSESVFDTTILIIQANSHLRFLELEGKITDKKAMKIVPERNLDACVKTFDLEKDITLKELHKVLSNRVGFSYR